MKKSIAVMALGFGLLSVSAFAQQQSLPPGVAGFTAKGTFANAAGQELACASMPTLDACVRCGASYYGVNTQTTYCQGNMRPGMPIMTYADSLASGHR